MRILVYGLSSQKGGVESFIINYCVTMTQMHEDLDFEFIVFDEIPYYAAPMKEAGFVFHVVPNRVRHPLKNNSTLKSILRDGAYDGLWYHVCTLSDVTLLRLACDVVPTRVVHSHNSVNMGNALNGALHEWHKKQLPSFATDFFSCSQEAATFMFPELLGSRGIKKVANGIDVERFRYDEATRNSLRHDHGWDDKFVVITVGRMHKQKNPLFLVDVFRELHSMNSAAHLVYVGDGPMNNQITQRVVEYGLEESVSFVGAIDEVEDYLSAADVFLLPSLYEGLPFAAVEAQASGLPVVMSEGVSEEAVIAESVVRLPIGDAEHWAATISGIGAFDVDRCKGASTIRNAGFDIQANAQKVSEWFLRKQREAQGEESSL